MGVISSAADNAGGGATRSFVANDTATSANSGRSGDSRDPFLDLEVPSIDLLNLLHLLWLADLIRGWFSDSPSAAEQVARGVFDGS